MVHHARRTVLLIFKGLRSPHEIVPYLQRRARQHRRVRRERKEFRRSENCLISFPKCGRTWLRVIVGKIIHDQYGLNDPTLQFLTPEQVQRAGLPRLYISHDTTFQTALVREGTIGERYKDKRVILLIRDVRDALVSLYHHMHNRREVFTGSLYQFLRSEDLGARRAVEFYRDWHMHHKSLPHFLLLRYEDLHRNTRDVIRKTLAFLEIEDVTDSIVDRAIENGGLDSMRRLELSRSFSSQALRPMKSTNVDALKVRKGMIGGYRDEMTEADLSYIESVVATLDGPRSWLFDKDGHGVAQDESSGDGNTLCRQI